MVPERNFAGSDWALVLPSAGLTLVPRRVVSRLAGAEAVETQGTVGNGEARDGGELAGPCAVRGSRS